MTYGQDGIYVNHDGMLTAVENLRKSYQDIENRFDRLEGELAPLQSAWSGAATQAYNEAKRGWDQEINGMQATLKETARLVETSHDGYKEADRRGAASFQH